MKIKNTYTKQHYILQEHIHIQRLISNAFEWVPMEGGKDVGIWNKGQKTKQERGLAYPTSDSHSQP